MVQFGPQQLQAFEAILLGFALAGLTASAFQLLAQRPLSFRMLLSGGFSSALAVPLLAIGAPFVILRNTGRGRRFERRPMHFVAIATVIACLWSLVFGQVVLSALLRFIGA